MATNPIKVDGRIDGPVPSRLYAKAMLIRTFEERLLELFSQDRLSGTVHTCIGQEWTGISVAEALRNGDAVFSTHRCHGHFLALSDNVEAILAEIMGKKSGLCAGWGGSQHLYAPGFFSNGVQGGIVPVAAGWAFSQRHLRTGNIAVVFIGDGTLGEGVVYESFNFASKWDLPLLVVLENNGYAQSTPQHQTLAGDICAKAEAFGIRTARSHTCRPAELLRDAEAAMAYVRTETKPMFLRIDTYRLAAHSKGDDLRDPDEIERSRSKDPITLYLQKHEVQARQFTADAKNRVDAAVATAESSPDAELHSFEAIARDPRTRVWSRSRFAKVGRLVDALNEALRRNLQRDERIVLFGEDIESPYGGAFKVTRSLSEAFPDRVRNTPVSEAALVGLGNGAAMAGLLPVCEIMFGDFITLAADQIINHAAKFAWIYNGQVKVPLVIRTPMGGKRGYGATHSQSLEKHFLGLPGTVMLALHHRCDVAAVYDAVFESIESPTIIIENKRLYPLPLSSEVPEGFVLECTGGRFPTTRLRPEGPVDVTLMCYGGMLPDVEQAAVELFDEEEIICEIVCPLTLYPFDVWPVMESVSRSRRLVIVEEGLNFCGLGAEAVTQINECEPGLIRRLQRVGPLPTAIPAARPLEFAVLPGPEHVRQAVLRVMA